MELGGNLPMQRCNQASQQKAELICGWLRRLVPSAFSPFVLFPHVNVLENAVWLYLSACFHMFVCRGLSSGWKPRCFFEFIFGRTGRKRQRNKSWSAQSDRNPILLGAEKVNVNTAWCKSRDWIPRRVFLWEQDHSCLFSPCFLLRWKVSGVSLTVTSL